MLWQRAEKSLTSLFWLKFCDCRSSRFSLYRPSLFKIMPIALGYIQTTVT